MSDDYVTGGGKQFSYDPTADDAVEAELDFNRAVDDELHRLRVRKTAQERLRAERSDDTPDLASLVLARDQLGQLPSPEPLIAGVLERHTYGLLTGRDRSYKTFIALDWCLCLATGKPWQGHAVERVRVLFVAGEGAYGIDERVTAWERAWGTTVDPDWFRVLPQGVDLFGAAALPELLWIVNSYGLVVLDTLRRVSGRAEGNSSDMGVVVDNIDRIKRATDNGSVLALAHTQKDDADARGFSGIEDDADTVWHAKRDDDRLVLENRKMKNGPDGAKFTLLPTIAHGSVIIEAAGPGIWRSAKNTASQQAIITALSTTFAHTDGASVSELLEVTKVSKSTFYNARAVLLKTDQMESNGSAARPRYRIPESNTVHPDDRPLTCTSPTSPTESNSSGPVQSSPPPLEGWTVDSDSGHGTATS